MIAECVNDIFRLFFPSICPACGERMSEQGALMCTRCMLEVPLTGYCGEVDNPVAQSFWGHLPIVNACSFITYKRGSRFTNLVHNFKYRGDWRLAKRLGIWYGLHLKESGLYDDVDVVVAVPLHMRKRLKRGYNQSQYLAEGIAASLGCEVDSRSVGRCVHNSSQTSREKMERWDNVKDIFEVRSDAALAGKHILLVDDVLTTGATIISCGEAIVRGVADCRLSIATLASTSKQSHASRNIL